MPTSSPIHIHLNRSVFNAATRLATLPASHSVCRTFLRCCHDFERIDPQRRFVPIPDSVLSAYIARTKDEARDRLEHIMARGGTCILTDWSGFEGGVGSAAVTMKGQEVKETRKKPLGGKEEHTVFEAEVCSAILALDIIAGTPRLTDIDLFVDCQPAIHAISLPQSQPGQYLLAAFHALLGRLLGKRRTLKVRIHRVPAHVSIVGNKLVSTCVKDTALGNSMPLSSGVALFEPLLPASRAATIASGIKAFTAR